MTAPVSHVPLHQRRASVGPWRPDAAWVLCVFVLLLVLVPARLVLAGIPFAVTPAMAVGLLSFGWWFNARLVDNLGVARGWQPMRVVLLLFFCCLLLSFAHAYVSPVDGEAGRAAQRNLVVVLAFIGAALLAADGVSDRRRLDRILRVLLGAVVAIAALGVVQFVTGFDIGEWLQIPGLRPVFDLHFIGERSDFRRPSGTATHAIEYGVVLATVLPIALHYAFYARSPRARWGRWISVAVLATAMLMSLSRSAILGSLGAGLMLFATWSRARRVRALLVLPVFLAATRLLVSGLVGTLLGLFVNIGSDPSYTGRTERYPAALKAFSESKILGRGFGTYPMILDNQYLGLMIETGLVGLAAVLLMFFVGVFTARGARRRSADPEFRDLAQALAAAAVVPLIAFITFDALAFPMFTGLMFLVLGLCGAAWRFSLDETPLVTQAGR